MPQLDNIGEFKPGVAVTIDTSNRSALVSQGTPAEVRWLYDGDDGSGEWVYVYFDHALFHQWATDPVTGYGMKGDPVFGPIAFRPDELLLA